MIDLEIWTDEFLNAVNQNFPGRVWFVGLQGSYGRGEATENSDIDMVVILDQVSPADLGAYRRMLDGLPHREKLCGFLSGREELVSWDPADLFQLYFDTIPLSGSLDAIRPLLNGEAVNRAIKMGACNIYHGCVHNMLHGRSEEVLRGLYKTASFVIQAICYRRNGVYIRNMTQMRGKLSTEDWGIVDTFLAMKQGVFPDFDEASRRLFVWAGGWIRCQL